MSATVAVEILPVHRMKMKYIVTHKMDLTDDENGFLYAISGHAYLSQEQIDKLDAVYSRLRNMRDTSDNPEAIL